MENEERFLPPEKLKANISIALTKQYGNYQKVADHLRNMYVGEDNLKEAQDVLRNTNSMLGFIEDGRKKDKEPALEYGRSVDRTYKEFAAPFEEGKSILQQKVNAVAAIVEAKERKKREEKEKQQRISDGINQFILDYSVKIASATSNEQLLGYERLINLEKANKNRYADQLPLLIERCNDLNTKIKEQKELIKEKERIEKEKKKADDDKMEELLKKEQEIADKMEENTILVQEQAANSLIINNDQEEAEGVKARRTTWKAELVNVKDAVKKSIEMLEISLNATKVRDSINTLKAAGAFKGKTELLVNGIRYYEEKTF